MRIDWKNLWTNIQTLVGVTLRGELPLVLKFDKILPQILIVACVMALCIFLNFHFEKTLVVREDNKTLIKDLEIRHMQAVCDLAKAQEQASVDKALKGHGINIGRPEKPARIIE
ncbi:MAG: hypothetical protein MJY67_07560 [Bacteroidales bacterium]|nr:hypothetical protein [Bacteroidales bacterium]